MEIWDDHASERDQFVILAFHDTQAKTFKELDEKLQPVIDGIWAGRSLPFPILLDSTGKTIEEYAVAHYPTTLLIDPEGKLVGEINPDFLETKLKKIPLEVVLPRKLDRNTSVYFEDPTLKQALANLQQFTQAEYEFDAAALKSLGLTEETKVPLTIVGMLSLRSALELLLDPVNLTVKVGPLGYIVTSKPHGEATSKVPPTKPQTTCAARIEKKLKESKYSFDFKKTPLRSVAMFFEQSSQENVVLDPRGRLDGKINPDTPVTGTGKDVPFGEALEQLIGPLGLRVVVRDEVIVIEPKAGADANRQAAAQP